MIRMTLKTLVLLLMVTFASISCKDGSRSSGEKSSSEPFVVQIKDKPATYCNPLTFTGAGRAGEPIVLIYKDDYYLFITGRKGYWYSTNMRDWNYVDAPTFPGGVPGVVTDGKILYACAMNSKDLFSCCDPKKGIWTKAATLDSDRYGDADIFIDDDGRVYMYFGWSQLLPIQVVELDPKNGFKEKGQPVVCFFGDPENNGFERRRTEDVIFPIMDYRPYFPEENPWIEGPWMVKHNNKYYLQYAAIGLEFLSYSHGVYVSNSPMGPFSYSEHNPLTFKTTGFVVGGGHGSTFHDKNGKLWTICMIPSYFGGRGSGELAIFPTAVDAQGVMHSNTAFGDYPQYYPGIKENAVDEGFTGWMLISNNKYVEVSSTLKGFEPKNAVDENFMTCWSAKTGNPGEYMTVDLGKECNVYALQINFDQKDANLPTNMRRGFGMGMNNNENSNKPRQSYTVQFSTDNKNWSLLIDKSKNIVEIRHDYTELAEPVKVRYVKLTNVYTPDSGKFAVKDLRIFGNPEVTTFTKVSDVKIVRNPEDRRDATLLWEPVKDADGYIIRYGIEPKKLYNSYMVYDANTLTIHSLNKNPEYYFEVEAFDNGTEYYREKTQQTLGKGAEIELSKDTGEQMSFWGGAVIGREMVKEGINEYVFDSIAPGDYVLRHTFGPVLWKGKLTNAELIGSGDTPTLTATLSKLGVGTKVTGQIEMKVIPGKERGKIVVLFNYNQ
jgi:xylan 1,4-beta-xylosidase